MVIKVERDVAEVWQEFKKDQSSKELRNLLIEKYLPLVRYNAERVWSKLPDGVDLNDLISAGVFGVPAGMLAMIVVSLLTPADARNDTFVAQIRTP